MQYYSAKDGMSLKEIVQKWAVDGDKAYDGSMPIWMNINEIWPFRDYTWTRETSRPGFGDRWEYRKGKEPQEYKGPEKWDALKKSIEKGWDLKESLIMIIGQDGKANLGEGNHRLAIAKELGQTKVPVRFLFTTETGRTSGLSRPPQKVLESFKEFINFFEGGWYTDGNEGEDAKKWYKKDPNFGNMQRKPAPGGNMGGMNSAGAQGGAMAGGMMKKKMKKKMKKR